MDATSVAELIREEHPQIIATILIHLDRQKSSEVLALFTDRLRNDVILRIATFGGVQPGALRELTDVLSKLLSGQSLKRSRMGGVRTAAEIINLMSTAHEEAVIDGVRLHDGDLAQKIIDEMFLFENLLEVDDRGIQRVLKEIATESLIVALKGAPAELRDKFIRNMSTRAGEMLREDLDALGPVRVSQVEAEQKNILQVVRRLADAGEVQIGGGDDAYVFERGLAAPYRTARGAAGATPVVLHRSEPPRRTARRGLAALADGFAGPAHRVARDRARGTRRTGTAPDRLRGARRHARRRAQGRLRTRLYAGPDPGLWRRPPHGRLCTRPGSRAQRSHAPAGPGRELPPGTRRG
ncbi:flagellar motor switch protein FliG [Cupriavidus basilensis]